jgi:hypothetical protein
MQRHESVQPIVLRVVGCVNRLRPSRFLMGLGMLPRTLKPLAGFSDDGAKAVCAKNATGFFLAPFAIDGSKAGVTFWKYARLSSKWLSICSDFLDANGEQFACSWRQNLSHIQTRLTSASGAAVLTFSVQGRLAESLLCLSGMMPQVDNEVTRMWVASLRTIDLVKATAPSTRPFEDVSSLRERPLMVSIPWANPAVSRDDGELVRELSLHLGAAYFIKCGAGEASGEWGDDE